MPPYDFKFEHNGTDWFGYNRDGFVEVVADDGRVSFRLPEGVYAKVPAAREMLKQLLGWRTRGVELGEARLQRKMREALGL